MQLVVASRRSRALRHFHHFWGKLSGLMNVTAISRHSFWCSGSLVPTQANEGLERATRLPAMRIYHSLSAPSGYNVGFPAMI